MKFFLRFYEELNDFLPPAKRKMLLEYEIFQQTTVKDVIESYGVPHTEVDLILVNNESVGFDYLLRDKDYVSVFPMFESFDISSVTQVREEALRHLRTQQLKFIVDVNLGKLAHFLRMLGFDVLFSSHLIDDEKLAHISKAQGRILLTRDLGLLKRKNVDHGYFVRSHLPKIQTYEVLKRFDLFNEISLCSRCLECNVLIEKIPKEEVKNLVPPLVFRSYSSFYQCPKCKKIYWEGTHFEHMQKSIEGWKARSQDIGPKNT